MVSLRGTGRPIRCFLVITGFTGKFTSYERASGTGETGLDYGGFYKGNVKRKHFSRDVVETRFSAFSPFRQRCSSLCAMRSPADRVLFGSIMLASSCLAILKRQHAESVVGVPTMVPSGDFWLEPGLTAFLGCVQTNHAKMTSSADSLCQDGLFRD